ncbi:hypothetical protein BBP40_007037 [Aspergillus hancockii]|nr:hypothetical protein BBP40_007037 [Aspergillus hancockii]
MHTAQLLGSEIGRAQRVEQLLLQFENENLQWQLNHANQNLTSAARVESDVRLQLHETCKELDKLRNAHRATSHEIERLRLELASLTSASVDPKTLLAEKLRLAKDLSFAQADIERLNSQKSSSSTFLTEKQTLERQLTNVEVQLENEKRAHEQTSARESHIIEENATLRSKLEETRKELVAEVQARDGRERAIQQQSIEWAAQRSSLEAKLDTLNKKLRSTKDQSQAAITQLQRRYEASNSHESRSSTLPQTRIAPQLSPAQQNSGITIATPGAICAQDKKPKISTLPGDKSSFSITPFLNRTNGLRNSSISSDDDDDDDDDDADELHTTRVTGRANEPSGNGASKGVYSDQIIPVDGLPISAETLRLGQGTSNVRKGKENQRNLVDNPDTDKRRDECSDDFTQLFSHGQLKTKKRKLGIQRDRSFFDMDDEEEDLRDIRRPGRKLILGTGRNPASQVSAPRGGRLGRSRGLGGLGQFSPLKRDKKQL